VSETSSSRPPVGPLYVAGRQHSGNTVTVVVFGMAPECYAVNVEGLFFEQRGMVDRITRPEARVDRVMELLRLEEPEISDATRQWLLGWHAEHPQADAVTLYRQAMDDATRRAGRAFWARRATSYIFYGDEIMRLLPDARMLYLLRNPWDISASVKRRDARMDRLSGPALSWNRGIRIAQRLQARYPDRFRIVRYEDMVREPEATFQSIFDFAGVPFRAEYLDVPHVNRSEAHQTRTSATRGFNASRVFYYRTVLDPADIAALDMLVSRRLADEHYPERPHRGERVPGRVRVAALWRVIKSPFVYAAKQVTLLRRENPWWRIRRTAHRLRTLFR